MNECNSTETRNKYSDLSDQIKFRLNEINEIKDYFNSEIQERKILSKKLSKYIAAFDCFDKALIVLSATSGGISIIFFHNCHCSSCRNSKYKFYSCIFFDYRNNKETIKNNKK